MRAFTYERAGSVEQAAAALAAPGTKIIAGGTNLLDLMKLQVETPTRLVDISRLPLDRIEDTPSTAVACGSARPCETATLPRTRAFGAAMGS